MKKIRQIRRGNFFYSKELFYYYIMLFMFILYNFIYLYMLYYDIIDKKCNFNIKV